MKKGATKKLIPIERVEYSFGMNDWCGHVWWILRKMANFFLFLFEKITVTYSVMFFFFFKNEDFFSSRLLHYLLNPSVCVCAWASHLYMGHKSRFSSFSTFDPIWFFFVLFWLTLFIISHNHHRSSLSNDIIIRGVFSEFFFLVNVVLIGKRLPLEPWNFVYTQR